MPGKYFPNLPNRPHLVRPGSGLKSEVYDLRREVDVAFADVQSDIEDLLTQDQIVWVSSAGSDVTGDGSQTKPWATVAKAIAEAPTSAYMLGLGSTLLNYIVRVVAPYTGPLGHITKNFSSVQRIPSGSAQGGSLYRITIQSWTDTGIGSTSDPRFTLVSGPHTPTAVATVAGNRVLYTLSGNTITADDLWTGEMVRVFQAGVEVARGFVYRSVNTGELLYVHPTQTYTPAITDAIYIVRPSVQLGGVPDVPNTGVGATFSLSAGAGVTVRLENIRFIDNLTVSGDLGFSASGCQFIANGSSGAFTLVNSPAAVSLLGTAVSGLSLDTTLQGGSVAIRGTGSGFLGAGRITVGAGSGWIGEYNPGTNPNQGVFTLSGAATFRGVANCDFTIRSNAVVVISSGTVGAPTLLVPRLAATMFDMGARSLIGTSGVIAVDAALSQGDVINLRDGARMISDGTPAQFVPADGAVPTLAAGIVVEALGDASAQVNVTSTLAGAGSVDVKAGDQAGLTWAALNALSPKRSTDTTKLASIYV